MDLLPTSEQQQIIDSTASFMADKLPLQRLHGKAGPPDQTPAPLWREIAEMGWLGLTLDEACGGVGYGASEEVLVFRELGRELAPPRLLFTAVAARAAAAAGDAALATRLSGGELTAALAVQDDFTPGAGSSLSKRRLFEANGADVALTVDGDHVRLLDLAGLNLEPRDCLDKSVSMSVADLSGAPVLCEARDASVGQAGVLLGSAMMLGLAEKAKDMIVEYAKIRQTFGRPIGAYQAVRHPCAEMAVRCEEAKSQLFLASVAVADGLPDAPLQVSAARVLCEQAALQNADDTIQLHGGIGVTDEFDTHYLIKRANVMASWFGYRRAHLETVLNIPLQAIPGAQ